MVKFWQNFKIQPHIWFFYGFLLTFTLSIRKVLFFYPIGGQLNEYNGIYLYLSDIFLILTILAWGYPILCNNKFILSNITDRISAQLKNVPRGTIILLPLLLVIWSFISLLWADNKFIALFRSIKLAEFYLLYLYIIYNVPRGTLFKRSAQIIIITGVIQSLLAVYQFILQQSLGLTWLRESAIGSDIPGVAKLIFDGHKIVRSYGLFPHPNILGGFLLISILLTWAYYKMFHVEQFSYNSVNSKTKVILIIQIISLFLTFPKSAILGLTIAALYIAVKNNVPRGTFSLKNTFSMFHVEHFSRKLILTLGIIMALGLIIRPDINSALFKSFNERLLYLNVSRGTILAQPLIGIGSGQFVLNMDEYVPRPPRIDKQTSSRVEAGGTILELFQYQPVHNVFLLIWSELGIIGLGLFLWWLWRLFHVEQKIVKPDIECSTWNKNACDAYKPIHTEIVPRGTFLTQQQLLRILKGALLGLIFIMLFDHYLWDIQQGEVMLWLLTGLIVGIYSNIDK